MAGSGTGYCVWPVLPQRQREVYEGRRGGGYIMEMAAEKKRLFSSFFLSRIGINRRQSILSRIDDDLSIQFLGIQDLWPIQL